MVDFELRHLILLAHLSMTSYRTWDWRIPVVNPIRHDMYDTYDRQLDHRTFTIVVIVVPLLGRAFRKRTVLILDVERVTKLPRRFITV
jgi:hypothetical protein